MMLIRWIHDQLINLVSSNSNQPSSTMMKMSKNAEAEVYGMAVRLINASPTRRIIGRLRGGHVLVPSYDGQNNV